jgi:hypothetical protein
MTFDVQITTDTNLDAFKIQQSIIEVFYKTQVYSVSFKGFRVPCQVGFPEDYGIEKTFEFTYETENKIQIKFTLAVETYLPVIDPTTTRKNSNRITTEGGPGLAIGIINEKDIYKFNFSSPTPNATYFSGYRLPIMWNSTGTILRVNLYYRIGGSSDWVMLARAVDNNGQYDWAVPFFNEAGTPISGDPIRANVNSATGRGAQIRAIINSSGEVERIIIIDGGFGYSNVDTISVSPLIQPPPGTDPFVAPVISANVADGKVVDYVIHSAGSGFTPTAVNYIELKIENEVDENVFQVYEKIQTFTGDTQYDITDYNKITNLNPSVAQIASYGVNLLTAVDGPGVEIGTKIINADAINNTLTLDKNVTLEITEGEYTLEPSIAVFEIL